MIGHPDDAPQSIRHFRCTDGSRSYSTLHGDKWELKSHSPFFGSSEWRINTFSTSECYDVVQARGMDIGFVNSLCAWFNVMGVDPRGGDDFITDAWMRVCAECPLMSHLVPESIKERSDAGGMIRFLWMGDFKWGYDELLLCARAVASTLGYTSVESRVVIRNEYDDQSYSDREVEVCYLMRETDRTGFGGKVVSEEGEFDPFHVMVTRAYALCNDSPMSSYGSWVYDIGGDIITRENLAVGMDVGR